MPVSSLKAEISQEPEREVASEAATTGRADVSARSGQDRSFNTATSDVDEPTHAASEAATQEIERRASGGAVMPRRLLLTISDAARMTQINSLIRSAGYEARSAFNGQQALALLRVEPLDLLLLDYELQGIDAQESQRLLTVESRTRF